MADRIPGPFDGAPIGEAVAPGAVRPPDAAGQRPLETVCPGCGVRLPDVVNTDRPIWGASNACRGSYGELSARTLVLGDAAFHHQLAVDAHAAQHLADGEPPIRGAFALAGLCLVVERAFTGRQVQRVHTLMARRRREWPIYRRPKTVWQSTVVDVMAEPADELPAALRCWCACVWVAYAAEHERVRAMLDAAL